MLVLSRRVGERLVIGDNVTIIVNRIAGNRVTIGIEAPQEVHVVRGELERIVNEFRSPSNEASVPAVTDFEHGSFECSTHARY